MPSVSKISGKEIKLLSHVWLLILGDIKKLHLKEWFWVLCIQYQSNNNTNGDHEGDEEDCLRHPWPPATPPLCRWLAFCRDIHIHSLRSGPAVWRSEGGHPLPCPWQRQSHLDLSFERYINLVFNRLRSFFRLGFDHFYRLVSIIFIGWCRSFLSVSFWSIFVFLSWFNF